MADYVVAVDVGTASARAGVFDISGNLLGRDMRQLALSRPETGRGEYDSEDIWVCCCDSIKGALASAGISPADVRGISFDATCSLVLRAKDGGQMPLREGGGRLYDTIAWFDHRAVKEAEECSATGHEVLDYIGGVMSPEMETPKLMWLARNRPKIWKNLGAFYDLCDFLTWRASGKNDRSVCALACKWTYLGHDDMPWRDDFFAAVGLSDMLSKGHLPDRAADVGAAIGPVSRSAASELGLTENCQVVCGLIDAHAGTIGTIAGLNRSDLDRHLALIAGTSTCVMALSPEPRNIRGIWGPYRDAVLPGLWLNEGGQSATGSLLDYVLDSHGACGPASAELHAKVTHYIEGKLADDPEFAARLHVVPDHHGNRSPLADPHALGVVSGLTQDSAFDALAALYYKTAAGIAYGVRHIIEEMNANGYRIDTLHVAGGHTKNPLLMRLYADATQCHVAAAGAEDGVLLGTAIVAAGGCGLYSDIYKAASAMVPVGTSRAPNPNEAERHLRGYKIMRKMQEQRAELEAI